MVHETVTNAALAAKGYPSRDEMVKMVNEDLIPFMDINFPTVEPTEPVAALQELIGYDFLFTREDGSRLAVWESYFLNPEQWKAHRLYTKTAAV